jgi:hypothetical protein
MSAITTADRGELVDLQHPDTQTYLADAFGWLRDLTAKGARAGSDIADDWSKELAQLHMPDGGLKAYLQQQDNWVANLFAEILSMVEMINPLSMGKQIAIWILEDLRDILRSLATLVDREEDTDEQTKDALMELGLAVAALAVPYVGRAGKIIARFARGFNSFEDVLKMLRHISPGDAIKYLKELNLPQHAGTIIAFMKKILGKVGEYLGRYLPKVKAVLDGWATKIGRWIKGTLARIQAMIDKAIAAFQRMVYGAASNMSNSNLVDKMPDALLDWVANQINGNLCESCVDNYFVTFLGYTRLYPGPNAQRDTSSFFGPDQGIDGLFEMPGVHPIAATTANFKMRYSGFPLSLVSVLDELQLEIPGVEGAEAIMREVESRTGTVPAVFHGWAPPTPAPAARRGSGGSQPPRLGAGSRPAHLPRFVVMEAKFGFHASQGKELTDSEWKNKLSPTQGGRQMSMRWIDDRLDVIYPDQPNGTTHPKRAEINRHLYSRWLYGCQPHNAESRKGARPRGGRSRVVGLAFFPPYALKGYDIDGMNWQI